MHCVPVQAVLLRGGGDGEPDLAAGAALKESLLLSMNKIIGIAKISSLQRANVGLGKPGLRLGLSIIIISISLPAP